MIATTLGELWDGDFARTWEPSVYVLRYGRYVFYVGKSVDPIKRVRNHIQQFSPVGSLVRENDPDAWDWTVELYAPEEWGCAQLEDAERVAIKTLRPSLNCSHNDHGQKLRARFDRARREWIGHRWDIRCGREPRYSMFANIRDKMRAM